jgi:sterile alpha motif and leucine zipper-containing kinase AZK
VDLYSFGIVLWELVCFKKPHYDQDPIQLPFLVGTKGLRPQLPKHVPPVLIGIMQDCWEEEPDQRPSFKTVIQRLQNVSSSIRNMDEIVDVAKAYEAAPDSAIA